LDEVFGEGINDWQHNVVVLLLILNAHQANFLTRLLHERKEVLEFNIVSLT
jgi:hypothetical protein